MKILGLNANKKGRGTYFPAFYFMRGFARLGHDVTLYTVSPDLTFGSRTYMQEGVRIIEGPNLFYRTFSIGCNVIDAVKRSIDLIGHDYDLVYGTEYQPVVAWPVYLTRCWKKYRFISHWCDWYAGASNQFQNIKIAHRIDGFFEERIRFLADAVVVNNTCLEQRALRIGLNPEKIIFSPDGANTDVMRPYPQLEQRKLFNIPLESLCLSIIFDGSDKRVGEVFERINREFPDCCLLMIGRRNCAAYDYLKSAGLLNRVIETGPIPYEDVAKYLSCADVCFQILTDNLCNRARCPVKVYDYLAVGKATVISDVGDVASLFKKNQVGLVADGRFDSGEFAEKINFLLKNPDVRLQYGRDARAVMVQAYDWQVILKPTLKRIIKMLEEKHGTRH